MFSCAATCLDHLVSRYPALKLLSPEISAAANLLVRCAESDHTIFVCGNGGSAADAEHIVGELLKGFMRKRPLSEEDKQRLQELAGEIDGRYLATKLQVGIKAVSLTAHVGLATAVINDLGGDLVYAQQLNALARPGDVLIALSTSGNARNVFLACQVAKLRGLRIIGMTGAGGGRLAEQADLCLKMPSEHTFEIQEYHLPVYHALCAMVEAELFGQ